MVIYLIVNHITGKYYIGQHKGYNLRKYLQTKISDALHNRGGISHLYNSMRKHPKEAWSIHALLSDVQTRPELDAHERDFIAFLKSQDPEYGYNICRGGEGFTGPHSEETRRKIADANRGRKKSLGEIAAMKATKLQKYGHLGYPGINAKTAADMTDLIFNGVRVLERAEGKHKWLCQCKCGNNFLTSSGHLKSGHTKSCGCLLSAFAKTNIAHFTNAGKNINDLTRTTINGINVVGRAGSTRAGKAIWTCLCICGKTFSVIGSDLLRGHTRSCGCQRGNKLPKVACVNP